MAMRLETPAFKPGEPIPQRFTADGRNVSPALTWSGLPAGTRELALIVEDPDAPGATPWVHWVIYKIPACAPGLPEAMPVSATPPEPRGLLQGRNSWGRLGYGGPDPPRGHGVHHYHFRLLALDRILDALHSLGRDQLWPAWQGHVLQQAELVGTYQR